MILLLIVFSLLPTIPLIKLTFNYVGWFIIIYLIGSYIQFYGIGKDITHREWGLITILILLVASASVTGITCLYKLNYIPRVWPYFFVSDSNKILSLALAVSSFMYFKNLKIPHSRLINAVGGATFGVLLIHANSDAMRTWLWEEAVNCAGNFRADIVCTLGYALGSVLMIFIVCAGIDWFRSHFIEPYMIRVVKKLVSPILKKASILVKI